MPKVINQTSVSVDSLQAKITLLETRFSQLNAEHKIVLDSIRSLDNALQKADIKTSFFSDQLSFQLTVVGIIFSIILALLGLVSWKSLIEPLRIELKNKIDNEIRAIQSSGFETSIWLAQTMYMTSYRLGQFKESIVAALRVLSILEENKQRFSDEDFIKNIDQWTGYASKSISTATRESLQKIKINIIFDKLNRSKSIDIKKRSEKLFEEFNKKLYSQK